MKEPVTHLAPHAMGKIKADMIFQVVAKARVAKEQFGRDRVIDGSIGMLLDDRGNLAVMSCVEVATRQLPIREIAPYAPLIGLPEFREDILDFLFGHLKNPQPAACVATAGATGAIHLAVWNFLEAGETFITHDFFWSPYAAIARNALRKLSVFQTYLPDGRFNVNGAIEATQQSLETQGRALLLLNLPCHNPTGICLSDEEVGALSRGLKDLASRYGDKPITLMVDAAYWDFEDSASNNAFIQAFQDLPENLIFCLAYSISKSLTRYGFRTGAFVVSGARQAAIDEIVGTFVSTIRGVWSNTPRIGQAVFSRIRRDRELKKRLAVEQKQFADTVNEKGQQFIAEAREVGLPHTPYQKGFFATLPTAESHAITEKLEAEHIFLVPMEKGVRIAFCALPAHQVPGLAKRLAPFF